MLNFNWVKDYISNEWIITYHFAWNEIDNIIFHNVSYHHQFVPLKWQQPLVRTIHWSQALWVSVPVSVSSPCDARQLCFDTKLVTTSCLNKSTVSSTILIKNDKTKKEKKLKERDKFCLCDLKKERITENILRFIFTLVS